MKARVARAAATSILHHLATQNFCVHILGKHLIFGAPSHRGSFESRAYSRVLPALFSCAGTPRSQGQAARLVI